ncbi:DNase I-like protein [Morchella conica CCBAS932]|uniref:DNase I-like protein n=1 Tax=Morchella conica CCBAS932 TaxID=1392247 RepID=A0A3N4KD83_9PEZI|nr:DNase I-like protein [Morchella conica CCBAS932]
MTSSRSHQAAPEVPKPLRPAHTGVDPFRESHESYTRASLDIPREAYSCSPAAPPAKKSYREYLSATVPGRLGGQGPRQRPLSMYSTFSPPLSPPTFRVESPRSPPCPPPPLNIDARDKSPERPTPAPAVLNAPLNGTNAPARPYSNNKVPSRGSTPSPGTEKRAAPPPPPPPPVSASVRAAVRPPAPPAPAPVSCFDDPPNFDRRPSLPNNSIAVRRAPLSPALQVVHDEHNCAPPIPARTSKPKITSKPPMIPPKNTRPDFAGIALAAPTTSSEERVSPFSTPPSSANNSPSRSDNEAGPRPKIQGKITNNSAYYAPPPLSYNPPPPPPIPPNANATRERNGNVIDVRANKPAPPPRERNGNVIDVRANKPAPPPPPRMSREEVRPRMKFEDSVRGQRTSLDDAGLRPDLPPRPIGGGIIGGIKARVPSMRGRSYSPPRHAEPAVPERPVPNPSAFLPPPKRPGTKSNSPSRQPSLARSNTFIGSSGGDRNTGYGDDSDEGADDQSSLSEYPDSSQANRRLPCFKTGVREIPCKYDVRLFAVCGKYVCTTSHSTNVWNIETGQCIMSLPHSEGTRITAIAFKPSIKVQDEGRQLWLGTSHGELLEVDIAGQRVIDSRSSAHVKKEIVQIHRCGYELWTLDEGGKLQVWGPDVNGVPNLKNSPTTFRIPNKHTFSLVVDGLLWIGAGKSVHVYQPSTDPSIPFNLTQRPLAPSKPTGEITCGAVVNSEPGKIYFGHSDGKVSTYSRTQLTCIDVISISLYKINSMSGVGDYLWAGFKTGMIYVYDVRSKPWRVLKDWQCSNGPVVQLIADRTSIWKTGRLQVVSLGVDNIIRLWDGMLEDDWLEGEMQKRDAEFCSFREIKALICTWNAGACKPQDLLKDADDRVFLENVLTSVESPDVIVFGFQELVDLENKKLTAKTLLKGGKKKKAADHQAHMSHQYRLWQQQLTKSIETHLPRDEPYTLLHSANLVGLFTCIFVKSAERHSIRNVSAATVKRGLGGLHGNKGALIIRFLLDDSSLCFINCHLAAGQSHTVSRNNDIAAILESSSLPADPAQDIFVGGGDGSMILDHEICILNGDLNYRIDMHRDSVISRAKNLELPALLERDQLLMERKRNPGFRLRAFNESPITFRPTYKYDVGTDTYDSSEKKRSPAWCDRLLYRGLGKIKQTDYRRWEVRTSDHRPVSGVFAVRLKTVDKARRGRVWDMCCQGYEAVRERHVWEAKMDFLVNVLGYQIEDAQRSIETQKGMVSAVESLQAGL